MIYQDTVKTSTGTVFKVKKAPAMTFQAVARQWEARAPKVPTVFIEAKGRTEENPSDPDYLKAKEKHEENRNIALFDAAILLCTEIDTLPEGMESPENEGWLEDLKILGIAPGPGKRERYLAWVKYYAAPDESDMMDLNIAISRRNGVNEGDVTAAMAAFKSASGRREDRELSPERTD